MESADLGRRQTQYFRKHDIGVLGLSPAEIGRLHDTRIVAGPDGR